MHKLTAAHGMQQRSFFGIFTAAALLLCLASVPLACMFGPVRLPFGDVLAALLSPLLGPEGLQGSVPIYPAGSPHTLDAEGLRLIVLDLRLPRVLLALCAGAGLAVAGAVFQGILRNPLADPFTLGVSGGAAFGAALAISLGLSGAAFGFGIPAAAFAGAGLALAAVLALGRIGGGLRHETLILAGVVVSALLAALIALIKALDESSVTGIVFWIMGSFQGRGWAELMLLLPGLVLGCAAAMLLHGRIDMLSLGDGAARSLGLNPAGQRLILLLSAGAITASCVAVSGIIGFIGLIVPHLCRMLLGASHGKLLPVAALLGALLLLWSDVAARAILPGGVELPVGVVTALFGGPFFCFILGKKQGRPVAALAGRGEVPGPDAVSPEALAPGHNKGIPDALPKTATGSNGLHNNEETGLVCRNLSFDYGRKRKGGASFLDEISFSLEAGEFVGLLGPNGSGKSTLLHCLSGELRPWSGQILIAGQDIRGLEGKERARLLAHLPQKPESVPALPVLSMALMGRYAYTPFLGGYSGLDQTIALASLEQTGVGHLAGRSADSLSGGELQRVLLARTFAQQAPVLLLDEAVSGLDPAFQIAVLELLKEKNASQGLCILAAMHDLNLASLYCRRLIFIKNGRIVADGPLDETFTRAVLEQVYDCPVTMVSHPLCGAPQALLSPGR